MLNFFLRVTAFIFYLGRFLYWITSSRYAAKAKPSLKPLVLKHYTARIVTLGLDMFILLQLLGLSVFMMPKSTYLPIIGLGLLIVGVGISVAARISLGVNWTHGSEYQVKKKHDLVTRGVYAYIRHPIYTGFALSYIGAELVAQSYLFISFLAFFIVMYFQGRREENLLLAHFGDEYKKYMRHTKMLIPFVL